MRKLSEHITTEIEALSQFHYCYEIITKNKDSIFLTSSSNNIKLESIIYKSNSCLSLKEANFNDSAQDYIILEGIFDDNGVSKNLELTDALVKICILLQEQLVHLITYKCTSHISYDLSFILYLEPESIKYNKTLVKSYSETCRADFGDNKCKFDKNHASFIYNIDKILNAEISVLDIDKNSGYFTNGTAILNNGQFRAKILYHSNNNFTLSTSVPPNLQCQRTIILTAGCDKTFLTCCNKFHNQVNFRGEPFIPKQNFLKVNLNE